MPIGSPGLEVPGVKPPPQERAPGAPERRPARFRAVSVRTTEVVLQDDTGRVTSEGARVGRFRRQSTTTSAWPSSESNQHHAQIVVLHQGSRVVTGAPGRISLAVVMPVSGRCPVSGHGRRLTARCADDNSLAARREGSRAPVRPCRETRRMTPRRIVAGVAPTPEECARRYRPQRWHPRFSVDSGCCSRARPPACADG